MANQFVLYEDASGYAIFKKIEGEEIAQDHEELQKQLAEYSTFSRMLKMEAFHRFGTAEEALGECSAIAANEASDGLVNFLELNLPKKKYSLGVVSAELGKALKEGRGGFNCEAGKGITELYRGCLIHFPKFMKDTSEEDLAKARCGLAHCFSRAKMQLDPNRQDKPIMNVIAILDGLDKTVNTFAMRVKEWYGWHFPELSKILNDNIVYAKVARVLQVKDNFDEKAGRAALVEVVNSEEIADEVIAALKISMGQDISAVDMANIDNFGSQVVELDAMRALLNSYLKRKMDVVAPNLNALIGEHVGARLISHAGSLINLAKYPASTVQILGAEKALFRALKTKSNTPKYGLLYHSTFIGRAAQKNKGRISRYLANKCSIASRIDCFAEHSTNIFGSHMKGQVEDRLTFLTEGLKPRKNVDVMREALEAVTTELAGLAKGACSASKKRKRDADAPAEAADTPAGSADAETPAGEPEKKKKKKEKKEEPAAPAEEEPAKKKKKKNKA